VEAVRDPLLFVGGAPRSGTTLLRNMLAAHPQLAVPDESPFIYNVYKELVRRRAADDTDLAWRLIRQARFFKQWQLHPARVEEVLARVPPRTYADVIRALFAAYALQRGRPSTADKTPHHALWFDWSAIQFPRTRFVHLVRDPREVCMALAVQPWHRGGIEAAAHDWVRTVRRARQAQAVLGDRFLELRFQELVARPAQELQRLCAFAGLPFAAEMLSYPSTGQPLRDPHHASSRRRPQPRLRRWQADLDPADIQLIELIAGQTMIAAGYEPIGRSPSLRTRLRRRRSQCRRWADQRARVWLRSRNRAHRA
jgi:hypothetical protein